MEDQKTQQRDRREDLVQRRERMGLTQDEAAQRAGIKPITVSRAERGLRMSAKTARALAKLYGVTVDEILGESPERPLPSWEEFRGGVQALLPPGETITEDFWDLLKITWGRLRQRHPQG